MARFFLVALLTAAAALLATGQLSHEAPSAAEVFWRALLLDTPLPDAILRLLHPDTKPESIGKAAGTGVDGGAGRLPRYFPYFGFKDASQKVPSEDSAARLSQYFPYFDFKGSSQRVANDDSAGRLSRYFPYFDFKSSSERLDSDDSAEKLSRYFPYFDFGGSSKRVDGDDSAERLSRGSPQKLASDESAGRLSRYFPYFDFKGSSQKLADDDGAGRLLRYFPYFDFKGSSQKVASHDKAMVLGTVFFHEEVVRTGESLPIRFPPAMRSPLGFLPRNIADSIPFATSALPDVRARFGIAADSIQAADMAETLHICEAPPLIGEAKFCATSLEALVEGAVAVLGTRDIRPVTSKMPPSGAPLQPYTIQAVRPINGSSFVACHDEAYPYTVYMCHDTGATRAYMVEMKGTRGSAITVAIICHTDTSQWNPEHVSFKLLGTKPGGSPVCHFMPYGHIIWAKNANHSSA